MRKPVFGVSDQVQQKPGYIAKGDLEAGNFWFRKKRDCTIDVVKTKVLISCVVIMQLICAFVFAFTTDLRLCFCICKFFAFAKSRLSHDMAQILVNTCIHVYWDTYT